VFSTLHSRQRPCPVEHSKGRDATKFYSKSYLGWTTYIDLLMSALSSSNSLSESRLAGPAQKKRTSGARKVLRDLSQRKRIDWSKMVWDRWISLQHLFGRNDDVQNCLAVVAMQRRIEEERWRKAWATAGYPYPYQQAEETALRAHTQEAMEVDGVVSRRRHAQDRERMSG